MLRSIDHFIGGSSFASAASGRARCSTPTRARSRPMSASAPPPTSRKRSMPPRPRSRPGPRPTRSAARGSCSNIRSWSKRHMDELAQLLQLGARQGHRRRQGRRPARARGDRILLRHPAGAEGRIYGRRRPRHRRLFDAPAARHRRRHHAVQLPGDDPDVDVRHGDRLRQCVHPQAQRARPDRAGAPRRADEGSGPARRNPQRRPRRQGDGRRDPRSSGHRGGQLRRHRPTSPNISTRAAPRTGSASRRSAGPRTTASSCPTPTSTRSSTTLPARPSARPASAAWRCRSWCRSATTPPTRCARS